MTTLPILTCPLKPAPEKSSILTGGITFPDPPTNACTREGCAWWLTVRDAATGQISGNCIATIGTVTLLNIEAGLRFMASQAAPTTPPAALDSKLPS
jgi:hypothetical protein